MAKVLMIVGSLRKDSLNRQMALEIEKLIGNRVEVSFLDYADLPYMNADIEFPAPAAVERVRKEVLSADGIWICSPEYNYAIPGGLKNLLDWLSRPVDPADPSRRSAVVGKPVTISGAAGKSAAAGVRSSLLQLLKFIRMEVIGGEGTGISIPPDVFQSGKMVFTSEHLTALEKQADELLSTISAKH